VAFFWQVGIVAAMYGVVSLSLRLLGRANARTTMLWTAAGIWT
jgi:alpha-1,2-mannosyltransferase